MRLEVDAYQTLRNYFLEHKEYTHLVICPDDLVIDYDSFMILKRDVEEYDFSNLAGIANIDESQPNVYCCKPLGIDITQNSKGSFYTKDTIPEEVFEAGFTGFACQWINRELMEKLSFTGGCNNGEGCMDFKFTEEIGEPQMVEPRAFFYHMRCAQIEQVKKWKNQDINTRKPGFNILQKAGEKYNE